MFCNRGKGQNIQQYLCSYKVAKNPQACWFFMRTATSMMHSGKQLRDSHSSFNSFIKFHIIITISCWNISATTSSFYFSICIRVPRLDNFLFYFFISAVLHTCIVSACVHFIVNVCTVTLLSEKTAPFTMCLFGTDYISYTQTILCIVYLLICMHPPSIPNAHAYLPCQ